MNHDAREQARVEWHSRCSGDPRCGRCAFCYDEAQADRNAFERPWTERRDRDPLPSSCQWPTIDDAIEAWFWYRVSSPGAPSALGGMLERTYVLRPDGDKLRFPVPSGPPTVGIKASAPQSRASDRNLRAAYLIARVETAVMGAFDTDNPWERPPELLRDVLIARTVGVPKRVPKKKHTLTAVERVGWSELEEMTGLWEGVLRAIVRHGRRRVWVTLAARGLVPLPGLRSGFRHEALELREFICRTASETTRGR